MKEFHETSHINKMFSVLQVKRFLCPLNHESTVMIPTVGLYLRTLNPGEQFSDLLDAYFARKISVLDCTTCNYLNAEMGSEILQIV